MDGDEKRLFDALAAWKDHWWAEYNAKTTVEWRFAYGLWVALLAAAGAVIAEKKSPVAPPAGILVGGVLVVAAHGFYLRWLHVRLEGYRSKIQVGLREMEKLLTNPGASPPIPIDLSAPTDKEDRFGIWSPLVQLVVTTGLCALLAWLLRGV